MSHQFVSTDRAPAAIGPYAQAVKTGPLTFISGQIPLEPTSGEVVGAGDVAAQTRQAMANLLAVLDAAGHPVEELAKLTLYLRDMDDFGTVNRVYAEPLGDHRPARAAVEVARLPRDVRIEIEGIAVPSS